MRVVCISDLLAFETRRKVLATFVEKNAERYINVKVDSENVSLKSSAETNCSLEVSQTFDKRATLLR